ncbi:ParB N-terminal domain-containing protein [Paludisphaera rhizosphaerae]|uniref:ParB N-terminal domain-containing protein n=1 Tax=Paludisphaera rhizosphaerae TaxID=2711216 RepID=UPI0013ECD9A7|nr:ParB N-terminal domain-containing protein [Paludisphaera rhizosphaerae]
MKKASQFADERIIEEKRRDGLVRTEEVSMKAVDADTRFQARVEHLDLGHVAYLESVVRDGRELTPISLFDLGKAKMVIGDGIHRHDAYRRAGRPSIPAMVIHGTEQDALEFAAAANQRASLRRKREDIRKAAFMLFGNGWLNRTTGVIADHIGTTPGSVLKWRAEYASQTGEAIPDVVEGFNGMQRKTSNTKKKANINFGSVSAFKAFLAPYGIAIDTVNSGYLLKFPIYHACGIAFVPVRVTDGTCEVSPWVAAVGNAILARLYWNASRVIAIVPDDVEPHPELAKLTGRAGVEFMTAHALAMELAAAKVHARSRE